jgi:F-box and WD-40 domain protein 1/11
MNHVLSTAIQDEPPAAEDYAGPNFMHGALAAASQAYSAQMSAQAQAPASTPSPASIQAPVLSVGVPPGPTSQPTGTMPLGNAHAATQAPTARVAPPPPRGAPENMARVFKLQFDARRIICCSQTSVIVGWDFANGDEKLIEASRFFAPIE